MLLINKIPHQEILNYKKNIIECLIHNSSNNYINEIIVYLEANVKDLPELKNVKYVIKRDKNIDELLEYSKKISQRKKIIISDWNVKLSDLELRNVFLNKVKECSRFKSIDRNEIIISDVRELKISENRNKEINNSKSTEELVKYKPKFKINQKLDVVIVSVNYNDYLLLSLMNSIKLFENIHVVTSKDDFLCHRICEKFSVNCIKTDIMYENNAKFNKGKAINLALDSLKEESFVLILDADIIVSDKIDLKELNTDTIYGTGRYFINNYEELLEYESTSNLENVLYEEFRGIGFFQLFYNTGQKYPETFDDASWCDLVFRDTFKNKVEIEKTVLHLGQAYKNWQGRITDRFLDENTFVELLNQKIIKIDEKELEKQHILAKLINNYNKPIVDICNELEVEIINESKSRTNGKKILFIIYLNDIGGAEYVSYQHIKMCKELGYNPVVLSADKGMFFNKIKDLDVDLFYSKLYEIDQKSIINVLYNISEDCDIIYNCNYFGITPYIETLKKLRDFKYYTIAHSDIEWVIENIFQFDHITDKYIVIHDKIRDEFNKKGVCNTRIITLPNFVDFEYISRMHDKFSNYDLKKQLNISEDDFVIGLVTRISPDKNILDAIKILSMLNIPNKKLLIVGDAPNTTEAQPYKKQTLDYIKELDIEDSVIITGHIDNEEVYKYISCFDIALNTSPSEGLPISLLEQMSCGIHCVYPSHGEIPNVLDGYGTIVNVHQKKSFDINDKKNYIFNRYKNKELLLFINEIEKIYQNGKFTQNHIKERIKFDRSYEKWKYYFDYIYGGLKNGVSFVIRAKNEELNVLNCLESIVDIADEIIFVDHQSTDNTYQLAFNFSKKFDNIKVFKYEREIPKAGENYQENIKVINNTISNYYNFCLSKVTKNSIIKWDADFIANRENLIDMIESKNINNRIDKFSLWFTGETIFMTTEEMYINKQSYYDEYRSFSLLNGAIWKDSDKCEFIDRDYANNSISDRYEKPCFYEIKRIDFNEFENRENLIDERDRMDFEIIENLKNNIIDNRLTKVRILNKK